MYDLVVIGSGPGGYIAAIHAAQKGMHVLCIEKDKEFGGTCLNVGCIPSKALLHSTEYFERIARYGKEHGITASELTVDLQTMMGRKEGIVSQLSKGVAFLFKKNRVESIKGEAKLLTPTSLSVNGQTMEAKNILLATGSQPVALPFIPFDGNKVLSSTEVLSLTNLPKKMLVIGGGVIGLELGSVYRRLGTEIEVIELLERIAPFFDGECAKAIQKILQKQGFVFRLATKVISGEAGENGVKLLLENGEQVEGDVALVAVGRRPYTKGLGLEDLNIRQDPQGRITIDSNFRTSVPNIYAIGDVVDGPMLAHKASEEGIAVVNLIAGDQIQVNYLAIPNVMYTWPEVASVGITEEEARGAGFNLLIGKVHFRQVPRALCSGDEEGFVKMIGESQSRRLLGMHIVGPNASEMIHEGMLAIQQKMTLDALAFAPHAHPTCSEAIKEAALAALAR